MKKILVHINTFIMFVLTIIFDLVMAIEDEFSVEIPEDEVENIKLVGDIVKYIEDKQ